MLAPITPPAKALQSISPVSSCPAAALWVSNIPCSASAAGTSKRQPLADALRLMWLMARPVPRRAAARRAAQYTARRPAARLAATGRLPILGRLSAPGAFLWVPQERPAKHQPGYYRRGEPGGRGMSPSGSEAS
jgi:hypothetical protein